MAPPAVLVRESIRAARALFDVGDELTLGGPEDDVLGIMVPAALIRWHSNAWWIAPLQIPVLVDDAPLVTEQPLHHGQEISSTDQPGWRLRFLVGDRERVLDELRHVEATIDRMTGLVNRRTAARQLERIASGVVMMIDIDRLNQINDQLGMLAGDSAIKRTAAILKAHIAWPDLAARYGGEEFLVLLPDIELVEARALAERIRRAAEPSFVFETDSITATLSIGLGVHAGTGTFVLGDAEEQLDQAKTTGRNRVCG